ncbi:uncharacterized protein FIESC28_06194 [Fusarium coffeatum]|uniref:Peptidase S8/S53 domain-containing protein n=1 Tax=Fusarium coffeatum TaxID=231269 RepID=A0A366RNQ8_9HYPO|nr:uncharacterized protein FIESC28_06194 [Fusarium coffeatum]RBR18128.1 hypothetical protein FIESC28_06194 [Fusarium coffeatum]
MSTSTAQILADLVDDVIRYAEYIRQPDDTTNIGARARVLRFFLSSALTKYTIRGDTDIHSSLGLTIDGFIRDLAAIEAMLGERPTAIGKLSSSSRLLPTEWWNHLNVVLRQLHQYANALGLAIGAEISLEGQPEICEVEIHVADFDDLAKGVLDSVNQIFPFDQHSSTGHESLVVEEWDITRNNKLRYKDIGFIHRVADDIGVANLNAQRDILATTSDREIETRRFPCSQSDSGFPSTKVRTVTGEFAGIERSLGTPLKVLLKSYKVFAKGYLYPEPNFHVILQGCLSDGKEWRIIVTNHTAISHDSSPLGRLFVTLEGATLKGESNADTRDDCKIHFGFDLRYEAESFARYLSIAQLRARNILIQDTVCDDLMIYYRELYSHSNHGAPLRTTFAIHSRPFGRTEREYRAIVFQDGNKRYVCFDFHTNIFNIARKGLLRSLEEITIWVLNHDEHGRAFASHTKWETLTGQKLVTSVERATHVTSGRTYTISDWLDGIGKLRKVMKRDRSDHYGRVKIAVVDSGLNDEASGHLDKRNVVYKDFTNNSRNDSWHGTCCAKIISDIYEEAILYVARIFENDNADEEDGPIRMAQAIDWAISPPNGVDIINISAGFRHYSKELDEAVTRAKAAGTLVVAAAANWQNTGSVAFPARHNLTTMCIYSTNMGNQSSSFNPEPRMDTSNFAILGEGFQHPDQRRDEQMDGTSMATAAAVGLAANIIDFSRQQDNKSYISRAQDVGKLPGMLSIFNAISKPAGPLRYVAPLELLPLQHGSSRERDRQRVREILSQAMERAN